MQDHASFQTLIQRIKDRDAEAARILFDKYEPAIRRVVRLHMRDERMRRVLDSMDVCQSVLASFFVRVALGQYELNSSDELIRLLSVITRNKVATQVQHHWAARRDLRRDTSLNDGTFSISETCSDPAEQASVREILDKVSQGLTVEERYLAQERAAGRTWKELSGELGDSDEALRKKLSRAVNRVMSSLGFEDQQND